jgi:hypothetical protein
MPTPTARLGLLKPSTSDPFVTADLASNLQKVDDTPGYRVCTSATRPSWTSAQAGMLIVETDTGLIWRWTGSGFVRIGGNGILKTTGGGLAVASRTTDFSTASTTYVVVLSLTNVVVPDGTRPLLVLVQGEKGENSNGALVTQLARGTVANTGPFLGQSGLVGDATSPTAGAQGAGFTLFGLEAAGLSAGTYSWSFQIRSSISYGGTSYIRAEATGPCKMLVIEL